MMTQFHVTRSCCIELIVHYREVDGATLVSITEQDLVDLEIEIDARDLILAEVHKLLNPRMFRESLLQPIITSILL